MGAPDPLPVEEPAGGDAAIRASNAQLMSIAAQNLLWRNAHQFMFNWLINNIDTSTATGKELHAYLIEQHRIDMQEETPHVPGSDLVPAVPGRGGHAAIPAVPDGGFCPPYAARALMRMSVYGAASSTATPEILKGQLKSACVFKPFKRSTNAWESEVTQRSNALRKVDASLVDNHLLCEWLIDSVWNPISRLATLFQK